MGFEVLAIAGTVVSGVVDFVSSAAEAKAQADQAKIASISASIEMLQAQSDADLQRLNALEEERQRRIGERFTQGQQMAIAAMLGIPIGVSQSFSAIQRADDRRMLGDIDMIRTMGREGAFRRDLLATSSGIEASYYSSLSRPSYFGAALSGLGTLASGYMKYASLGRPSGSGNSDAPSLKRRVGGAGSSSISFA